MRCILLSVGLAAFAVLPAHLSWAQVTGDGTLNTTVSSVGNNFTITNGTARGSNLFHSFQQFGIPTGGSATFDLVNTPTVSTIFSRVTGGSVSNIDGAIRTVNRSSSVSLFLINPSGILFGPNASLNISGSFLGTTASSIQFADGTEFSAVKPQAMPLLSVRVPVGLQMGSSPAPIQVQGNGHQLRSIGTDFPFIRSATPTGLQAQPGQTLALIGGKLDLKGGTLTAEQGQVAIASVIGGQVGLSASPQGWDFDYGGVSSFQDIHLSQQSMLDASGIGGGRIQVQGANISVNDGSVLLIQSLGLQPGGGIQVRATESLEIQGNTLDSTISSGLQTIQLGALGGSAIEVEAQRLNLQQGGRIRSNTYGAGSSSLITVKARDSTKLDGLLRSGLSSTIDSNTYGSGSAGEIVLSTGSLMLVDGGAIGSSTLATGNAANVTINVDGMLAVRGVEPTFSQPTNISSVSIGTGNAGNLIVNAQRLTVQAGGRVASSTIGLGNAGSVIVNAAESVEVQGRGPGALSASTIESAATIVEPALQQRFNLPPAPSGASGNVILKTPNLSITDGAAVSVKNDGVGNGGNLFLSTPALFLDRQGSITATTRSGEGGNLQVQADSIVLRRGSSITATAGGTGNGGDITINAPVIAGFENSDIIASAVNGRGGNIQIRAQGIFGLKFRNQLTPDNDISASSQFGINGTVQVNTIGVDPNAGLVELPIALTNSSRQIVAGCAEVQGNQFTITGRGGIPANPTEAVNSDRPWLDLRDPAAFRAPSSHVVLSPPRPLTEANTLRNARGELELVVTVPALSLDQTTLATCARTNLN